MNKYYKICPKCNKKHTADNPKRLIVCMCGKVMVDVKAKKCDRKDNNW